ncbi:MAG: SsrA-binding protein SmpB [Clostridia bacterium]|jgi:SsrA-binding protein|nr:SsrA-binding protein SmpB [Clostridia bacterium]
MKLITENRQARHEYFIEDTYQCGIVLEGSEVKSIRAGSINLKDSFCLIANGEVFVKNMHIAVYDKAGAYNTRNSKRDRKLLLRKAEINKLIGKVGEKGYALIPLEVYFEGSLCKLKMGLCKGKHTFDKKETIKQRDLDRSVERELKNYR